MATLHLTHHDSGNIASSITMHSDWQTDVSDSLQRFLAATIAKSKHSIMFKLSLLTLTLCLVACGNEQLRTAKVATTDTTDDQPSQPSLACTADAECPSGQRCGFRGKLISGCIVDSHSAACIPPGGSCGCDGRPVERICDAGTGMVYTSAPACFVGPCPKMCSDTISCPPSLTCQNGLCGKP